MKNLHIKGLIKSFIPPILFAVFRNKQKVERLYLSYEDALKNCANESGYEEDDIVKVVLEKTKRFKNELENKTAFQVDATTAYAMLVLNKCFENTSQINVLDYGGACGAHYFTFRSFLNSKYRVNWIVVETTNMCKYAIELQNDELRFYDDIDLAVKKSGKIDLIFSSGTIQSVNDPRKVLHQLINLNTKYIFFTRLSLTKGAQDVISVQKTMLSENGIGSLPEPFKDKPVEYPHTNMPENEFEGILNKSYKVLYQFNETSGIHSVNDELIVGYGVLLKKSIPLT
jgi:putative methyltransferase (TIGR04325 family)